MAAALLGVGGFYLVTAFVVYYGVSILGYSSQLMLLGGMVAAVVEIPVLILGGRLGERFGASRVILYGGIGSAVAAVPAFLLITSGTPVLVILGMTLAVATLSLPYAANGTILTGPLPGPDPVHGCRVRPEHRRHGLGVHPAGGNRHGGRRVGPLVAGCCAAGGLSLFTAAAGTIAPRMSVDLPGFKH